MEGIDMAGKKIAGVEVLRRSKKKTRRGKKRVIWVCRFPCGHTKEILGIYLRYRSKGGKNRECKICLRKTGRFEMLGNTFGGAKVLRLVRRHRVGHGFDWRCELPCGHTTIQCGSSLRRAEALGKQVSCKECRHRGLTLREEEILTVLIRAGKKHPTMMEVGAAVGIHFGTVSYCYLQMEKKGYLQRFKGSWRSWMPTTKGHRAYRKMLE